MNNRKTTILNFNIHNSIIGCNYFINFLLKKVYKYLKNFKSNPNRIL